jgi:hypothetical protein
MDRRTSVTECRSCGSTKLEEIYSLGSQYISGFWDKDEVVIAQGAYDAGLEEVEILTRLQTWPLNLVYCKSCELLQLSHNAPQELLYQHHYWYRSGTNYTMTRALEDVVKAAQEYVKDGVWLDIGANDGTLLSFVPDTFHRIGVEPADNLQGLLTAHAEECIHDYWSHKAFGYGDEANVITAIGMLYDLEDPNQFVSDMKKALATDGIIICQLMCLEQMLENNDIGNICHEHLEYYSLGNLSDLFGRHELRIFRVEGNEVNGGSYRLFACHDDNCIPVYTRGSDVLPQPNLEDIYWFTREIEKQRDACVDFIKEVTDYGSEVWVYGASTKGNVILQYYGLTDELITAAADRNPAKWGKVMAGSNIPIVSEDEFREARPDYALMLPYAFKKEFQERELGWWRDGGSWIIPLPKFHVVGRDTMRVA